MKNMPKELVALVEAAKQAQPTKEVAQKAFNGLDMTSLNDNDTEESIATMLAKVNHEKFGHVAATCVYGPFLRQTFNHNASKGIKCATVVNFPSGKGTVEKTKEDVAKLIASGANEIDIVIDYESFLAGDTKTAEDLLRACREACGPGVKMKVILESAVYEDYNDLYAASVLALECGADFLKTSTGKHPKGGATLEAVATMGQAIIDTGSSAGIKVSGGVKKVDDCAQYIGLIESMMGKAWIAVDTFRIGASGVIADIMTWLTGAPPQKPATPGTGY